MKQLLYGLVICFCAITTASQAMTANRIIYGPGYNYFARFGLGATRYSANRHQLVNPGPNWPDDLYLAQKSMTAQPQVSIGGGINVTTRSACGLPYYSVGLDYTYAWDQQIRGHVFQYQLPEFENYRFKYSVQRNTFMLSGKLDLIDFYGVMPYVVGGVGYSLNRGVSYKERALPGVTPRISPGFRGTTTSYFSYIYGVGLDVIATEQVWLSLEFTTGSFGNVKTGNGLDTSTLTGYNYAGSHLQNKLNSPLQGVVYITYMPCNL